MPPHYFSLPIWALTAVYIIIALLALVTGNSILSSYLTLKRQKRSSTEGNKVQAVGWLMAIAEVANV